MALYAEFENENSFRAYPFAEGSVLEDNNGEPLDTSMFIDAMMYPSNPYGRVRITAIDFERNTIEVSDDNGVIGVGDIGDNIKIYNNGTLIGRILTHNLVSTAAARREFDNLYFASSCVLAFNPAGVTGVRVGNEVLTGKIVLDSSDTVTPELVSNNGEYYLSLNIIASQVSSDTPSIKRIFVLRSQGTIFDVGEFNVNSLKVSLGPVSRDDICENAHREDSIDIYDKCGPYHGGGGEHDPVRPAEHDELYDFPVGELTKQAFNIVVPNASADAIVNPINVQMTIGTAQSNPPRFTRDMSDAEAEVQMKKLTSSNVVGNGIILQIPGLQ